MKTTRRLVVMGLLLWATALMATDYTWKPWTGAGTYNWTDSANWTPAPYPNGIGDSATVINVNGDQTIDLGGNTITLKSLFLGDNDYSYFIFRNGTFLFNTATGNAALTGRGIKRDYVDTTITLQTNVDVTVLGRNAALDAPNNLDIRGALNGPGTLNMYGPGIMTLTNNNAGWSGELNLYNGVILNRLTNWASLGSSTGAITLGSVGGIGWLANATANTNNPLTRPLRLENSGGGLWSYAQIALTGPISGPGRLYLQGTAITFPKQTTDNTYSGGTVILSGQVRPHPTNILFFGTGDIRITGNASLLITSNQVAPGAKVFVDQLVDKENLNITRPVLNLAADVVPAIDPRSSGILNPQWNTGPNFNARVAVGAPQLGNGYMPYGAVVASAYFSGTSLQPNLDGVYRFFNAVTFVLDNAPNVGVLIGTNQVEVFDWPTDWSTSWLSLRDPNTFSGRLLVHNTAMVEGYVFATGSGLGDASGEVDLRGGRLCLTRSPNAVVSSAKGKLTFQSMSEVGVSANSTTYTNTFTVDSLVRTNRGMLAVWGRTASDRLGMSERFLVANGAPVPTNGMLPPYFVGQRGDAFLTYDPASGFSNAVFTSTDLATAGATDIVNLTNSQTVPSGGVSVYALRLTTNLADNGTADAVTIGSGGLIFNGGGNGIGITNKAPVDFGTAEGVIYLAGPWCAAYMSNTVSGLNGLTVGSTFEGNPGPRFLYMCRDNNTNLHGTITINQGVVVIRDSLSLGPSNNVIVLNGGSGGGGNSTFAGLGVIPVTLTITNHHPIWLGPEGGAFYIWYGYRFLEQYGKISGPGGFSVAGHAGCYLFLVNGVNDYGGATWIQTATVRVGADRNGVHKEARLGTNDVVIGGWSGANAASGILQCFGNNAIDDNSRVLMIQDGIMMGNGLQFYGAYERIGSLEGCGRVLLSYTGGAANATTLYVGGNNRNADFFGYIVDPSEAVPSALKGSLVKEGAGTMALWGYNTYRGTTTVRGGTLQVNGTILSAAYATNGATLGGSGLIASNVSVIGATLAPGASTGVLTVRGNVTLDANSTLAIEINGTTAGTEYDQLKVEGGIDLGGCTLNLVLGSAPPLRSSYTIIDNDGTDAVTNQFAGDRSVIAYFNGKPQAFIVNYQGGDGNDVVLNSVPMGSVILIR